ncbi:MAG TPA: hypothetical protein PLO53_09250 [Candidatus Hydrogenedentes bacterium]|nr:hypothetical protein [Candidatus Hydrogenedentota bacterium]
MAGRDDLKDTELDAIIEAALREPAPTMRAPIDFSRKVEERVNVLLLREREKARFRAGITVMVISVVVTLLTAAAVVWFTHLSLVLANGTAGNSGQMDTWRISWWMALTGYRGAYTLMFSILVGVATFIAIGFSPYRRSRRYR